MKTMSILAFFFMGSECLVSAQTVPCSYSIEGKILDIETKEPIPYVSIKVKGLEKYTITNLEGNFVIEGLCTEKNTLIISCTGYCDSFCDYHAQHEKPPHIYLTQEVLELGPVTIKVKRGPAKGTKTIAQTTLTKREIKSNPTQSLASIISDQPGISFTATGSNVELPVIHGLSGNRILILNNGIKHGFQNWGSDHAPEIDISAINNITIIKGAAGVRYGPEALGGAIITEPNPLYVNTPFYTNVGTGFQTNGKGIFTRLEAGKGLKNWSYFLNGKFTKVGDRNSPDYSLTNSGKEEKSINLGTRYNISNWDFKLYYSYIDQNLALLRSSVASSGNAFSQAINADKPSFIKPFSYAINEPNQLTLHHFVKAEASWWYSGKGKLSFIVGKQLNKRKEYDVRRNADKPIINLDLITSDYQVEWKHPDLWKLDGVLGIQYFTQNNTNNPGTGTTPFIPNYNTYRYSAFLIESRTFEKNTLEAGIRLDYETNNVSGRETNKDIFNDEYSFSNLTSTIGYSRKIHQNSVFKTNLGTAWRTPNMAELYSYGQHGFKSSFALLRYYTNSDGETKTNKVTKMNQSSVSPERGYKFINEFQTHNNNSSYAITAYSHYIENYIFTHPYAVIGTIRGPMPVFIYDQANALFVGTDFSWKKDWGKQFSGTFGISYLWSKNIQKNEPLINQPPVSTNYKLTWSTSNLWIFESSAFTIKPSYTFQKFYTPRTIPPEDLIDGSAVITPESEIFDFKDAPDGYFLLEIAWNFTWKNLSGSITANNLLNARYRNYLNEMRYFADEPGRNILFTLNYAFKGKTNALPK